MQSSLRKYAATVGVSHTSVAKAIKAGHIINGWDSVSKKINVEIADSEWGNEIRQRPNEVRLTSNAPEKSLPMQAEYASVNTNSTMSEARRLKEIYQAEIARIIAMKKQGIYVEKEKVYSHLYELGKSIRTSLQAIPDRHIDEILACKTRIEAHTLLLTPSMSACAQ